MSALKTAAVLFVMALLLAACGDVTEEAADLVEETETALDEATEEEPEPDGTAEDVEDVPEEIDYDGVDPESVALLFVQAVADGDYETAFEVADQPALDFFEPWEPNPEASYQSLFDNGFFVFLGPGFIVQCDFGPDGYVASCAEEGEPEYDEPVEEEPVEEDQIAPEHGGDEEEFGEYRYDDPANYTYLEYLFPEPGGTAEVREGGIVRGTQDAYVVTYESCCAGDTLYVDISSLEDNAVVYVYGPDGTELATETTSATLLLDQDGEYWITVGAIRGNAEYTLEAGIAVDAS